MRRRIRRIQPACAATFARSDDVSDPLTHAHRIPDPIAHSERVADCDADPGAVADLERR
jgi:hypothetical protein